MQMQVGYGGLNLQECRRLRELGKIPALRIWLKPRLYAPFALFTTVGNFSEVSCDGLAKVFISAC
jgi:hypothetical protein